MDPSGVENARDRWGLVTRLMHLDELVDGNSPFSLYKKAELEHFNLQIGEVGLDAEIPPGIGILEAKPDVITGAGRRQPVTTGAEMTYLIDPMTKEVISKVAELDEFGKPKLDNRSGKPLYKVNDHFFVLNAKFRWKDAPKAAVAQPVVAEQAVPYTPPPTTTPTRRTEEESSSRRTKRSVDIDL